MNRKHRIVAGFLAASAVFFGIAHAQGSGCDSDGKPGMRRSSMPVSYTHLTLPTSDLV